MSESREDPRLEIDNGAQVTAVLRPDLYYLPVQASRAEPADLRETLQPPEATRNR